MPYKKSYRSYRKKKTYPKSNYQLARKVNYLSTMVNSEMHYHTLAGSGVVIPAAGAIRSLSDVVLGDTVNERNGNSILPRYLSINMSVYKGTSPQETYRIILFRYWGEGTDAAPVVAVGDVLDTPSPFSYLNDNNTGSRGDRERRIEIMRSRMFTLDNTKTTIAFKWNVQVNGLKVKNKTHIKYRSSATEQPVSGGFYLLFISDSGPSLSAINFNSKLNFHDN